MLKQDQITQNYFPEVVIFPEEGEGSKRYPIIKDDFQYISLTKINKHDLLKQQYSKEKKLDTDTHNVPIFHYPKPDFIKVAKAPYTPNTTVEEKSLSQIEEECNFIYADSFFLPISMKRNFWQSWVNGAQFSASEKIIFSSGHFVLVKKSSDLGYGLHLSWDADPIPEDTVIGSYTGEIKEINIFQQHESRYVFDCSLPEMLEYLQSHAYEQLFTFPENVAVDAEKFGNFSRFISHAPSEEELEKFNPSDEHHQIATANVEMKMTVIHGCPEGQLVTINVVNPGEEIFISYQPNGDGSYWGDRTYCLFDRYGSVIGEATNNQVSFYKKNDTSFFARKKTQQRIPTSSDFSEEVPLLKAIECICNSTMKELAEMLSLYPPNRNELISMKQKISRLLPILKSTDMTLAEKKKEITDFSNSLTTGFASLSKELNFYLEGSNTFKMASW